MKFKFNWISVFCLVTCLQNNCPVQRLYFVYESNALNLIHSKEIFLDSKSKRESFLEHHQLFKFQSNVI